ncbi:hypothetical protein M3629_06200 [Paenibacillus polysaccharolyticus]|uniref:hypothetical protein n=1 Tax=Paenibacillus polysaccharolyticus TaxID=582692 RepID=UPI00203E21F9|nr:hypothetical protein [Paenibacillus polysaccharolyticus]MCM3132368.1 hypothetical protein [Paenibacillus polysaccharolyticus]
MKAKALLLSGLFLALATSASAAPSTTLHTEAVPTSSSVRDFAEIARSGNFDDLIITPNKIFNDVSGTAISKEGRIEKHFEVEGGYGYLKVYIENKTNSRLDVVVTHVGTNFTYKTISVPAKDNRDFISYQFKEYEKGVRSGGYVLTFKGGGDAGKPVDAYYKVLTSNNKNDF